MNRVQRQAFTGVRHLLEELSSALSPKDYAIAWEYLDYNEWGLAFEHALDALQENDAGISKRQCLEIERLCKLMSIDNNWSSLQSSGDEV